MLIPLYSRKDSLDNEYKYCCGFPKERLNENYFLKMNDPTGYFGLFGMPFEAVFKEYSDEEKYYFPIVVSFEHSKDILHEVEFPEAVIQDIMDKNCKVLIMNPYEGWAWDFWIRCAHNIMITNGWLSIDDFVVVCANLHPTDSITTVYNNFWERQPKHDNLSWFQEKAHVECLGPERIRPKKFICLNRRPHAGRIALATELYDYKDEGYLSLGFNGQMYNGYFEDQERLFQVSYPDVYDRYIEKDIRSKIPITIDDGRNPETENPVHDWAIDKFYDSFLHICPETYQYHKENRIFFSEKIFKPIMWLQPFVIVGEPFALKTLKEMGYKTFDQWIDESYDEEIDNRKRMRMSIQAAIDFFSKPETELASILSDMSRTLNHNSSMLLYRSHMMDTNLRQDLRNALYG